MIVFGEPSFQVAWVRWVFPLTTQATWKDGSPEKPVETSARMQKGRAMVGASLVMNIIFRGLLGGLCFFAFLLGGYEEQGGAVDAVAGVVGDVVSFAAENMAEV